MPVDDKTIWISLGFGAWYVWDRGHQLPSVKRLVQAVMSMAMGYASVKGDIFPGWSPIIVGIAVTALGPLLLDAAAGVIKDRAALLDFIKGRFFK